MSISFQDLKKINHSNIYFFLLIILSVALPLSKYVMSLSQILLLLNWLIEGNFNKKLQILKTRKSIILLVSIIIIHFIWLIPSHDIKYGLDDIRIKMPLLILPLIIGTSKPLNQLQIKKILMFFIVSVTFASIICTFVFLGLTKHVITNYRDISIFISHIRFALLINVAIFCLVYFLISKIYIISKFEKYIYVILILWLTGFLFILNSSTGIVVLLITSYILIFYYTIHLKKLLLRILFIFLLILFPTFLIIQVTNSVLKYYTIENINFNNLENYTIQGNKYYHNKSSRLIENGHYIWLYVCEKELNTEWNKISDYNYGGKDLLGQDIRLTLIRYLASLGYKKDAEGIKKLKKEDVRAIEDGYSNFIFKNKYSIYPLIYKIIWEIDIYNKTRDANAHTLTQRIEFLKTANYIIKDNFWFGVSTGDLQLKFNQYYNKLHSSLIKEYRLRAHNQFVTFFITFGIFGFIYILFALVYPIILEKKYNNYYFIVFLIIAILSMLNEDTIETQAGATFFAFFYCIFLFSEKPAEINNKATYLNK